MLTLHKTLSLAQRKVYNITLILAPKPIIYSTNAKEKKTKGLFCTQ